MGWRCQGRSLAAAARCDGAAVKTEKEVYLIVVLERDFSALPDMKSSNGSCHCFLSRLANAIVFQVGNTGWLHVFTY